MAVRLRDFVGIAEGIRSHELSTKSQIENLKGHMSELSDRKSSLNSTISYLEAAIAAAYEDTDEDGDPDYGLIASLEAEKNSAENELSGVEQDLDSTGSELESKQNELEAVEEEKAQTLFEIQERARKTSQNISLAGGMYGAYAGVGGTLQNSLQTSFSSLTQAAGILGGSVDGASVGSLGNSSSGLVRSASGETGTSSGVGNTETGTLSAFTGGYSGETLPLQASRFSTSQDQLYTPATMSNFHSGQKTINPKALQSFSTEQKANEYALSSFGDGTEPQIFTQNTDRYKSNQESLNIESQFATNPSNRQHTFADWLNPANYQDGHYIGTGQTWGYKPYGKDSSKYSSHIITPEIDALIKFMSSNGYGEFDFDKYSKDPTWQRLHEKAYPNLHVPLMKNSSQVSEWNKTSRYYAGVDKSIKNNTIVSAHSSHTCCGDINKAIKYVSEMTGLTGTKAESLAESVIAFSCGSDSEIRKAQLNADYESDYFQHARNCEEFIKRAPKFGDSAALYRGVHISKELAQKYIAKIRNGGMIDQLGMASWSTSKKTAEDFAKWKCKPGEVKVVFRISGTKMGTSIKGISTYSGEDEVLVSGEQTIIPVSYELSKKDFFSGNQFLYINAIEL